ncbi:MAG: polysaccharide deacetylase family protein [Saprospiraceae bacterium]|nr:polysaccharide deacetylase family protein [Saprospiraceae bacterium]
MFFTKIPKFLIRFFPSVLWRVHVSNAIYLTFDDGPNPASTPALLQTLEELNIKATFFCLGCHAEKYPELVSLIKKKGHTVASHGYNHISGWKTSTKTYIDNVNKASDYIPSNLFRPPFGKISLNQFRKLRKTHKIVMWDIMPGDFHPKISVSTCVSNIVKYIENGSIIVLHDAPDLNKKTRKIIKSLSTQINREFKSLDSI